MAEHLQNVWAQAAYNPASNNRKKALAFLVCLVRPVLCRETSRSIMRLLYNTSFETWSRPVLQQQQKHWRLSHKCTKGGSTVLCFKWIYERFTHEGRGWQLLQHREHQKSSHAVVFRGFPLEINQTENVRSAMPLAPSNQGEYTCTFLLSAPPHLPVPPR